jgi:hypothetical protein
MAWLSDAPRSGVLVRASTSTAVRHYDGVGLVEIEAGELRHSSGEQVAVQGYVIASARVVNAHDLESGAHLLVALAQDSRRAHIEHRRLP